MENIEIERKFIVDYVNNRSYYDEFVIPRLRKQTSRRIVQHYIKANNKTVMRLRKTTYQNNEDEYFLTVKFNIPSSEHQTCYEVENKISKGMYESLIHTDEPGFIISTISKTRYYFGNDPIFEANDYVGIESDNHVFEIDVFDDSKHGPLILIEVEFQNGDDVVIPDYLKNLPGFREVTNDPQYFNCNLI